MYDVGGFPMTRMTKAEIREALKQDGVEVTFKCDYTPSSRPDKAIYRIDGQKRRRMRALGLSLLLLLVLLSGCGVRLATMTEQQKEKKLNSERANASRLTAPVRKTRSHILVSRILLDLISRAAAGGDVTRIRPLLSQYTEAIRATRDTMVDSDRSAEQHAAGFKDLELALRENLRHLRDLSRSLSYDQREPVDETLALASSIRDEMIRRLFPQIELSNRSGGSCPGHPTGGRLRVAQPRRAFACA